MRSVTEQGALEEFLSTAQLAGIDFRAEKMSNVQIIQTSTAKNPYLLTADEERNTLRMHRENRNRLSVPRRPKWDENTTPAELDHLERDAFLVWRRGLAELQDNQDLLMTPFERNLEVWRQLWRVIERSDLVVQIVDARNPLLFRSADLEDYVKEVDPAKNNLMLINKADMMTDAQRRAWARHLTDNKIAYKFFSAQLAKEANEQRDLEDSDEEDGESAEEEKEEKPAEKEAEKPTEPASTDKTPDDDELDTRILTTEELESLFLEHAPKSEDSSDRKLKVGLVGYPNVGKSSTINALIGAKKVSVSSTPGKTKHFQTIHLSERVVLCDCPGLVFPNFATTKADLVCNGILPIDQLREFSGPAGLVATRIPKNFLEAIYGITIYTRPKVAGGTGLPTAEEFLSSYARARGFTKAGQGQPDESRAARYILKDYVNGRLLYVAPPPGQGINAAAFNKELYDMEHLPEKRRLAMQAAAAAEVRAATAPKGHKKTGSQPNAWENDEDLDSDMDSDEAAALSDEDLDGIEEEEEDDDDDDESGAPVSAMANVGLHGDEDSARARAVDEEFFSHAAGIWRNNKGAAASTSNAGGAGANASKTAAMGSFIEKPFSHKYTQQGKAAAEARAAAGMKQLTGRKARLVGALDQGMTVTEARRAAAEGVASKKHHKGGQRGKGKKKAPANARDEY